MPFPFGLSNLWLINHSKCQRVPPVPSLQTAYQRECPLLGTVTLYLPFQTSGDPFPKIFHTRHYSRATLIKQWTFVEHLTMCRVLLSALLIYPSMNLYSISIRSGLFWISRYKWRNWGIEKLANITVRNQRWTQQVWLEPLFTATWLSCHLAGAPGHCSLPTASLKRTCSPHSTVLPPPSHR